MGRLISPVWKEFTDIQKPDGKYVVCNHCKNEYTRGSGTTNLKRHLVSCLKHKIKKKEKRSVKSSSTNGKKNNSSFDFDLKLCYKKLARMIVIQGYPLSIVSDIGFKMFVKNLQPRFDFINEDEVKNECMQIYEEEKFKLRELFEKMSCRVSFTFHSWDTGRNVKYVCLSCHYIDDDWNLNRKILNFLRIDALQSDSSKVLAEKITEWNMDKKIFSIISENYNEIEHSEFNQFKNVSPLNGEFFHVQTAASVLNIVAHDTIKQVRYIVDKVRENVQYVSSEENSVLFQTAVTSVGAVHKTMHSDMQDNWGTAYSMLKDACEFEAAFIFLAQSDKDYTNALSYEEWDMVRAVTECLSVVYHTLEKFSNAKCPTSNLYFNDVCYIHLLFKKWRESAFSDIATMASHIYDNFDHYWSRTRIVMAIASVLDPRYKMKSIEYYFDEIYDDKHEADTMNKYIRNHVANLFNEYANRSNDESNDQEFVDNVGLVKIEVDDRIESENFYQILIDTQHEFDLYIEEKSSTQSQKSELDLYFDEDVYQANDSEENFAILHWWKVHAVKYPVLSTMARDILSIPVSSFTADSDSRVLNQHLSSLDSVITQGLICGQDWLKNESEGKPTGQTGDELNVQKSSNFDSDGNSSMISSVSR